MIAGEEPENSLLYLSCLAVRFLSLLVKHLIVVFEVLVFVWSGDCTCLVASCCRAVPGKSMTWQWAVATTSFILQAIEVKFGSEIV
jgi:hypothetical protein